jgi:hypothetical protein
MAERLNFKATINASVEKVWNTMLDLESYKTWTAVFHEGSYYEGSWEKGNKIKFLVDKSNFGIVAEIAENIPYKFISIRHLGTIKDGEEDTTSDKVKSWAPAYENYTIEESDNNQTTLYVDMDSNPKMKTFFEQTWPKALAILTEMCEN